ncbi:MAG: hypothetical protein J5497_01890 [Selenomonadaceae bacterium]|nr:hypothetical protein [Selenomonadaceae bacterium]
MINDFIKPAADIQAGAENFLEGKEDFASEREKGALNTPFPIDFPYFVWTIAFFFRIFRLEGINNQSTLFVRFVLRQVTMRIVAIGSS